MIVNVGRNHRRKVSSFHAGLKAVLDGVTYTAQVWIMTRTEVLRTLQVYPLNLKLGRDAVVGMHQGFVTRLMRPSPLDDDYLLAAQVVSATDS
jgi:hypothetical protein